ncbi:hypothetical protein RJ639_035617 [Escallonia herrerae]|uniref:Major facilitator superfamily (MFS) profile domain-containing protein n=1 Tax=Escallonia herrerae TaxID=1293975 RepID=A0AA88WPB3_9ASTE|nr:hypothetical protein RJ639_035617 [Escallonia herrerae]
MERESIEHGQSSSSPLLVNPDGATGSGAAERQASSSSSPATPVLVLSTLVAVSGSYVFGSAVRFSSPAQSGIMDDLGLSLAEYSVFGSILTIGAMIGAVMSGKKADLIGRRGAMGFSRIFCIMGWLAILFSKVSWLLDLGRLSLGYGIGLLSYVVPIYIAEITPKNLRGAFTTVNQLMICCGVSVMYLVGTMISWRMLALIGTIPCLLELLGLFLILESPRWLAKIGRNEDCESALQHLRGMNVDITKEAAEIRRRLHVIRNIRKSLKLLSNSRILDLFQRAYAHSLIVGVGLMVLQQLGGVNAIAYYASAIFVSAGFSGSVGTRAMVIVQVPVTMLGVLLMDKLGRRPLLMVQRARYPILMFASIRSGTCLGCFLMGLSFLLRDFEMWKEFSPIMALIGILVFTGSFSLGMGRIPWVLMSEIFPINIKGLAGSVVTIVNWFGSWVVSYAFNFVLEWSSEGTFFIFSGVCGLTFLFVAKLVPETKGRTLEEIQAPNHNIQASTNQFSAKYDI